MSTFCIQTELKQAATHRDALSAVTYMSEVLRCKRLLDGGGSEKMGVGKRWGGVGEWGKVEWVGGRTVSPTWQMRSFLGDNVQYLMCHCILWKFCHKYMWLCTKRNISTYKYYCVSELPLNREGKKQPMRKLSVYVLAKHYNTSSVIIFCKCTIWYCSQKHTKWLKTISKIT